MEDEAAVAAALDDAHPEAVIHCAAWTDVDGCEADPERADRINGAATALLARQCAQRGICMVYVSTDFVFDGTSRVPYRPDDPTCPVSAYGRSKRLGEVGVIEAGGPRWYVVRTSWVFGPGGKNFPRAILARARSGQPLSVVDDQRGSPTMTRDLAEALLDLAASRAKSGVYHASNEGSCTWHQFAVELLDRAGFSSTPVATISGAELGRPAQRPAYSVLDCTRLTELRGRPLPSYLDAVDRYLSEESP